MEIRKFILNIASQFEETNSDLFTEETKYKNLEEWSSLTALTIIGMIDEEYMVKIKGEDIRNCETINDLFVLVKSKVI
jgi:acyl carrier protein